MAGVSLIKHLGGTWEQSRDLLSQDLDTVQRTLNYLLKPAAAAASSSQTEDLVTIDSSNHVMESGGEYLSSVAVSNVGALTGDGTLTNPLAVATDGSTVSVNASDQLTAVATVAAAGALTGNGSVATPLAVAVDGSTITIVGNQLTAPTSEGTIYVARVTMTNTQIGTGSSVPVQLIAAPGANKILRIFTVTYRLIVGTGWGSNPNISLYYAGDTNAIMGLTSLDSLGSGSTDKFQLVSGATLA